MFIPPKTHKCSLHKYHYPPISDTDVHHIIPREYKGPTVDWNLIEIGPTEHRNIHEYIDAILYNLNSVQLRHTVPKLTKAEKNTADQGLKGLWSGVVS